MSIHTTDIYGPLRSVYAVLSLVGFESKRNPVSKRLKRKSRIGNTALSLVSFYMGKKKHGRKRSYGWKKIWIKNGRKNFSSRYDFGESVALPQIYIILRMALRIIVLTRKTYKTQKLFLTTWRRASPCMVFKN